MFESYTHIQKVSLLKSCVSYTVGYLVKDMSMQVLATMKQCHYYTRIILSFP